MRAGAPKQTAIKGSLDYVGGDGAISIPIFIYRRQAELKSGGIEFHLYHSKCHTRILTKLWCANCKQGVQRHQVQRLTPVGETMKHVTEEELIDIFNSNDKSFQILGTISLKNIPTLMMTNSVVFHDSFMVRPMKMGSTSQTTMPSVEKQVRLLFDALGKNQQALYLEVPGYRMRRKGLLLPSGDLLTLKYEEEIREDIPMMFGQGDGYERKSLTDLSAFLKTKNIELESAPSCSELVEKVDELLLSKDPIASDNVSSESPGIIDIKSVSGIKI